MMHKRIGRLERDVETLHDRIIALDPGLTRDAPSTTSVAAAVPLRTPARVVLSGDTPRPPAPARAEPPPKPEPALPPADRPGFENLVGGKLPIWIGGAALVVAAFFLVRYSIESELIGPGLRAGFAAAFSVALIAASEAARRLALTRDDPRIGQVLAGAGVASAYGTLYVAAAQYQLVGPAAGFALMVAVTAIALFLALRHGPPTAIMALIGGFAAPLVAGFDAAGLGALLAYLALFVVALMALAVRRGWSWLAIAAILAGFGWANLLVVLLDGRDAAGVAAFVVALAIGATLALPAAGEGRGWLRVAPLVAGLVQLLVFAPVLDFGALAWSFDLVLAAAALVLAWRDRMLLPAAVAAAVLIVVLIAVAVATPGPHDAATGIAAIVATALFGVTGSLLSRRDPRWAATAVIGFAGPVLAAHAGAARLLPDASWTALELAAAAGCMALAWRHRDRAGTRDLGLVGGTAAAALLAAIGLATLAGPAWASLALVPLLLALGGWARLIEDADLARFPAVMLMALAMLAGEPISDLAAAAVASLAGEQLSYPLLPALVDLLRQVAAPALAGALLLLDPRGYGGARRPVSIGLAAVAVAIVYALAKQPLAIATPAAFVALGFAERAAITLLFAAAGWGLARRTRFVRTGLLLAWVALFRFVWFDLLVLNPAAVAQQVGPIPLVNLAVALPAALALIAASIAGTRPWRLATLALTAAAFAAAVRQIAHGSVLTGPQGSGETWGYSAAFLALAVAWLWRGIATSGRDLRVAGLALLTLVTLKVFLVDVAALGGLLRILSFLALGVALIGIGWAYGRIVAPKPAGSA